MNTIYKIIIALIVLVIIVWGGYYLFAGKTTTSGEPIKIGSIAALTGVGSAIGEEEMKGVKLAIEEINQKGGVRGKKLELVAEDLSIDKLKVAGTITSKLININRVVAIVGPQWDEPAAAIVPIIEEAKVPTIGPDTTDDIESQKPAQYLFSTWFDNRVGIEELLKFAQEKNWKKIAIIRPFNGGFWQFTRDIFVNRAPAFNVTITNDENLGNPLLTDFRTFILKIKANKPDAVFMVVSDYNECVFMKQTKELGLNVPVLSTEAAGNNASLGQCPDLLENLYFSTPIHTQNYEKFAIAFKEMFGKEPQFPTAVTAYDALGIIAKALLETNGEGGEKLRNAIAATKDYEGASLPVINFNEKGFMITPADAFEMQTVRNGKFVPVSD